MPSGTGESPEDTTSGSDEELAAAEAMAAEARSRAEAARTRAEELRRQLDEAGVELPKAATPAKVRKLRFSPRAAVAAVVVGVSLGLLIGTGYMLWQHQKAARERHRTAEFAAAGRQAAVNLMSMDFNTAKDVVQRILDDSTGRFKTTFQDASDEYIKGMEKSKVITKVVINDVAVESMENNDAGVVLIAATSRREGPGAPQAEQQPRTWRVAVTLERDGGRLKISQVNFI